MAEIVNLRQMRKQKARQDKEKTADANRLKFGRTKAERKQTRAEAELETKKLDQQKLDKD